MRIPKARGTNGVHYILKRLRTFYNWAVNTGRTTNNPFYEVSSTDFVSMVLHSL